MRRKLGLDPSRRSQTPTRKPRHAMAVHGVRAWMDGWNAARQTTPSNAAPASPSASVTHAVHGPARLDLSDLPDYKRTLNFVYAINGSPLEWPQLARPQTLASP